MGTVYLMFDEENEVCKIGATTGRVERRLRELQTGNSSKIHVIDTFETPNPFRVEKFLHNHYRLQRKHGEWFYLSNDDIDKFQEKCKWATEIIKSLEDNPFYNRG